MQKIYHLTTTSKQKHKWEYLHDGIGYNHRMSNLSAALGLAQLENLKKFLKFKRKLYTKYHQAFKSFKKGGIFKEPKNSKSNYWLQTLILDKKYAYLRNKILKETKKNNIFTRPAWKLISESTPYKKNQKMLLPIAKEIYNRVINLPSSGKILEINFIMNISKISIEPTSEIIKVIKVLKVTGKSCSWLLIRIKNLLEPLLMVILEN